MDNATAEYTFIKMFFSSEPAFPSLESSNSIFSPQALLSPIEQQSIGGSQYGGNRSRANSITMPSSPFPATASLSKEEQVNIDAIWKQVFDPVVEYLQTFVKSTLEPMPPVIPLLTMIRLTEDVVEEIENRNCPPVASALYTIRMLMWPVFQKAMTEHTEAVKRLAEGGGGYLRRASSVSQATVLKVRELLDDNQRVNRPRSVNNTLSSSIHS